MRAFAGGFYNNLKALYDHLGVPYNSQPFLFEFAQSESDQSKSQTTTATKNGRSHFVHASNLHQLAPRPDNIGIISHLLEVLYLITCYGWFSICCFLLLPYPGETLRHYLERSWIPQRFVTYYLVPLISSVTTCPHDALLNFPASDVTEYKRRTHGAPHYTVSSGVHTVQNRLVRNIKYELSAVVKAVEPQEKGVKVTWGKNGSQPQVEYFDKVILAVAPDVVGQIFKPLHYHMSRMPTILVESVVHKDHSLLGTTPVIQAAAAKHHAQLIYLQTTTQDVHTTESHHVQPCSAIVTTCPHNPIDPSLVLHSAKFTRVLRSPESQRIVNAIFSKDRRLDLDNKAIPQWRNGDDDVWLAGGWCWDGMVLLEGCVISALRIADGFDVEVPWRPSMNY